MDIVVFLATSRIYVQNLIQFGKFCHEAIVSQTGCCSTVMASQLVKLNRTNHEKF